MTDNEKAEHRRVLELLDAVTTARDRAEGKLDAALARCAELEHHLSPAPYRSEAAYLSEGERGKSQVRQNAVAGEETLEISNQTNQ